MAKKRKKRERGAPDRTAKFGGFRDAGIKPGTVEDTLNGNPDLTRRAADIVRTASAANPVRKRKKRRRRELPPP